MENTASNAGDGLNDVDSQEQSTAFHVLLPLVEEIPVHADAEQLNRARRLLSRGFALMALAVLAYLPCFWAGLLDGEADRLRHLTRPEAPVGNIHQLASWFELGPRVPTLLRILIYAQHGPEGSASIWQICGVGLHAASAVLLWLVLRRLSQPVAWLAAFLFAVHPANVPAVAWVSEQARLWAGMFSILGTLLLLINRGVPAADGSEHADYFVEANPGLTRITNGLIYLGAVIAFLLAILCQPATAVVPIGAVLLICWKRKWQQTDYYLLVPLLAIGIGLTAALFHRAYSSHFQFVAQIIAPLGRIVADTLLMHLPGLPWVDAGSAMRWLAIGLGGAILLVLPLSILYGRRVGSGVAIASALLVILLPSIAAPLAVHASGESLTGFVNRGIGYLCEIPILVLVANAILYLCLRPKDELKRIITQLLSSLAIGGVLIVVTFLGARTFGSTETLLKSFVASEPHSNAARSRLAQYYLHESSGKGISQAEMQLAGVSIQDCTDVSTAVAEGDLAQARGRLEDAVKWYERGQALEQDSSEADMRLAELYARENRIGSALACYEQAIQRHPDNPELQNSYALLLGAMGHSDAEIKQFERALEIDPDYVPAHVNLASAYIRQGRIEEGAVELQAAVQLDPDNYDAFHNAGEVLAERHEFDRAIRMLTTAVQLRPDSADARNDLGVALVGAGKLNQAIFEFHEALRLAPSYQSAGQNLQVAQRRLSEAKIDQPLQGVR